MQAADSLCLRCITFWFQLYLNIPNLKLSGNFKFHNAVNFIDGFVQEALSVSQLFLGIPI